MPTLVGLIVQLCGTHISVTAGLLLNLSHVQSLYSFSNRLSLLVLSAPGTVDMGLMHL